MKTSVKRSFSLLILMSTQLCFADEEAHFDIYVGRPTVGTQTVVGGASLDGVAEILSDVRVFEAELGENPLDGIFFGDEPGFNNPGAAGPQAPGAVTMQAGDTVTVTSLPITIDGETADLFYWDGVGVADLAPASGVAFVAGNPFDAAAADGSFDDHPILSLDDLDNNAATFPATGIYLASFNATLTGLTASEPLYLVMGTEGLITAEFLSLSATEFDQLTDDDLDEALEAVIEVAVEFVEANVVVPEPTSALLAVLAAGAIFARRK